MELGPIQLKWIEALEKHPEKQKKHSLGLENLDGTYQACCLGEGGLIAGVCEWYRPRAGRAYLTVTGNTVCSGTLDQKAYKALGLRDRVGSDGYQDSLVAWNDGGKTWTEIAAELRANPEKWFTHSV